MAATVLGAHLPRHSRYWFVQGHDIVATVLAFLAAFLLRSDWDFAGTIGHATLFSLCALALIAAASYHVIGLYRGLWSHTSSFDILVVVKAVTLMTAGFLTFLFLFNQLAGVPRSVPLIHWFISVVVLSGSRLLHAWRRRRQQHAAGRAGLDPIGDPVLLIGCNPATALYLASLHAQPDRRERVVGILDNDRGQYLGRTLHQVPVIGRIEEAERCIQELAVHGVFPRRIIIVDQDQGRLDAAKAIIAALEVKFGITLELAADAFPANPVLSAPSSPLGIDRLEPNDYLRLRYLIDRTVAALLILLLAPCFLVAACAVLLDVGRPIMFLQVRPGFCLRPFVLAKFRTMRRAVTAQGEVLSDEQRVSPLGRWLRRTKLDELPQLLSIVKGDMAFIGPRPLLPRDLPPDAVERATVRPGVTGWAQVNGGHQLGNEQKLQLDLWYIKHASIALDLKIVFLTLRTIVLGEQINRIEIGRAAAHWALRRMAAADHRPDPAQAPADAPRQPGRARWHAVTGFTTQSPN